MADCLSLTTRVFISYAKEDKSFAEKLYNDLRQAGVIPWLDSVDLTPGQPWETTIRRAIKDSSYFLALLSSRSVRKRGFVQREIRYALNIAGQLPEDEIFIIPVRIDECEPSFEGLQRLHRADLFPSYESALGQLLRTLKYVQEEKPALVVVDPERLGGTIKKMTDAGFGFISYNFMRKDLFFHRNELVGVASDELQEGDNVSFQMAEGPKGRVAVNVQRS
jgi:cold shock CspA family protein